MIENKRIIFLFELYLSLKKTLNLNIDQNNHDYLFLLDFFSFNHCSHLMDYWSKNNDQCSFNIKSSVTK